MTPIPPDDLLGWLCGALPDADAEQLAAQVAADPHSRDAMLRLQAQLQPLERMRAEDHAPPVGLALATIATVAAELADESIATTVAARTTLVETTLTPTLPRSRAWNVPVRRWLEVGLMAGIGVLTVGLVLGGVVSSRRAAERAACANQLRDLHRALSSYADANDGQFPQVGTLTAPTAGSFTQLLVEGGHLPAGSPIVAGPHATDATHTNYAYTLGYRDAAGALQGMRRVDGDGMPLVADRPAVVAAYWSAPAAVQVTGHRSGQNVLFAGGHVVFATRSTVGPNNDDIYTNQDGQVRAGLNKWDASLGGVADRP
jgi:prepilin-type processing-associated H-X9-DG protein